MTDLPTSQGYDAILVFVDRFSKTLVVLPCHKKISTAETVDAMLCSVISYYGIPSQIISDRGTQYASKVFQQICK
jgi:transposase InsO family protein